jgi:hypothetical protein
MGCINILATLIEPSGGGNFPALAATDLRPLNALIAVWLKAKKTIAAATRPG